MTTNFPNQVDGDVQALIADCQAEIEDLKRSIDRCDAIGTTDYLYHLQSKLKRQYAALAALTAEPFEYLTLHQGCRAPDDCEIYSTVAEKGDKSDDGSGAIPVYTTPPAQLLRPVELPKKIERDDADGYWMHKSGRVSAVNAACFNEAIKECAEALCQQGYEVKS